MSTCRCGIISAMKSAFPNPCQEPASRLPASHILRRAKWIWPADNVYFNSTYVGFRKDFSLNRTPSAAPFFITADQSYILYVNGTYVGRGPARGFQRLWSFDEYDIARFLRKGKNWIAVRAYNGGISTFSYLFEWHAGLLAAGAWDGTELLTGPDWLSSVSPAYRPSTVRVTTQMNLQEQVDTRLDDLGWIVSPSPPGWRGQVRCKPYGVMPWHELEPRGIPNLGQTVRPYRKVVASGEGRCVPGYEDTPNVADLLRQELPGIRWTAGGCAKRTARGLCLSLPAAGKGRFYAATVDLGAPSVGTVILEATAAKGGEIVDFYFCEVLAEGGYPVLANNLAARVRLRSGTTRYELYQMMGHRYLTAVCRDLSRPVRLSLSLRETVYPLEVSGSFSCNDAVLNDIYGISVRTQRICMLDAYVDTPWREQAQWWGDARVQARNTFFLADDSRLLVRGIRCLARQEVPNGLTYAHAPTNCHGCIIPDFSLMWILTIWDYFWQTGRTDLFREQWGRIERVLSYFCGEGVGRNGLLRYDERYWLLLDWSDLHKVGTPSLLNLWYLICLEKLSVLACRAGMGRQKQALNGLYRRQKELIVRLLWDGEKGLFRDGLGPDGSPVPCWSIHTQTLAILAGLRPSPDSTQTMVAQRLLPYLRGEKVPGSQPSSFWVTYVYEVMTALNHGREVVSHIRRRFAPMVPYGGTWEVFDFVPGKSTVSHAWSAHAIQHLPQTLGGIRQTAPAWRRITFAPVVDLPEVRICRMVVPTPQGEVRVRWERGRRETEVELVVPERMRVDVVLPGIRQMRGAGIHRWKIPAKRASGVREIVPSPEK